MRECFAFIRSLSYATAFCGAWGWLALQARKFDPLLDLALPPAVVPVGYVLMLLGGAVDLWCIVSFSFAGKGTPAPFDAPRAFVAAGPYRFVRNPMYVGAIVVLSGFALVMQSSAMFLFAFVALACAHGFVVGYEEPHLARTFGSSYADYVRRVPRWLPRAPFARRNG
jgi:protein-S-isoprenylcysteine O-methyltransferase Ste14